MDVFPKHILEQDITGCVVVTNDKVVRAPQCLQLCKQKHMWPPEDNSALKMISSPYRAVSELSVYKH